MLFRGSYLFRRTDGFGKWRSIPDGVVTFEPGVDATKIKRKRRDGRSYIPKSTWCVGLGLGVREYPPFVGATESGRGKGKLEMRRGGLAPLTVFLELSPFVSLILLHVRSSM